MAVCKKTARTKAPKTRRKEKRPRERREQREEKKKGKGRDTDKEEDNFAMRQTIVPAVRNLAPRAREQPEEARVGP